METINSVLSKAVSQITTSEHVLNACNGLGWEAKHAKQVHGKSTKVWEIEIRPTHAQVDAPVIYYRMFSDGGFIVEDEQEEENSAAAVLITEEVMRQRIINAK